MYIAKNLKTLNCINFNIKDCENFNKKKNSVFYDNKNNNVWRHCIFRLANLFQTVNPYKCIKLFNNLSKCYFGRGVRGTNNSNTVITIIQNYLINLVNILIHFVWHLNRHVASFYLKLKCGTKTKKGQFKLQYIFKKNNAYYSNFKSKLKNALLESFKKMQICWENSLCC